MDIYNKYNKFESSSAFVTQWMTVFYYTQPNCQGTIVQFITQVYPTGLQSGCNEYTPTDVSMSDIASAFITYSFNYPNDPTDSLTQGENYVIAP